MHPVLLPDSFLHEQIQGCAPHVPSLLQSAARPQEEVLQMMKTKTKMMEDVRPYRNIKNNTPVVMQLIFYGSNKKISGKRTGSPLLFLFHFY